MKGPGSVYKGLGGVGTLGMEIVVSFLLGLFGGRWLDNRYGTAPWLFLAGMLLGIALSVKAVLRAMKLMRAATEQEEREQGNPKPLYESSAERADRKKRGEDPGDPVVDRLPDGDNGSTESGVASKPTKKKTDEDLS